MLSTPEFWYGFVFGSLFLGLLWFCHAIRTYFGEEF
jgi:hypothetical protein